MVTHPDINPVQQGLTSVNRREPVFFPLVIAEPLMVIKVTSTRLKEMYRKGHTHIYNHTKH